MMDLNWLLAENCCFQRRMKFISSTLRSDSVALIVYIVNNYANQNVSPCTVMEGKSNSSCVTT